MTQLATGSIAARAEVAPLSAAERFGVVDMPDLTFTPAVARETEHLYERVRQFIPAIEWPVYEGARLKSGNEIAGPAIVEQPTTTLKIAPGWRAKVDAIGNLLMWRGGAGLQDVLERKRSAVSQAREAAA